MAGLGPRWALSVDIERWLVTRSHQAIMCVLSLFRKRKFGNGKRPDIVLLTNKDSVPEGSGHGEGKARMPSGRGL